MSLLRLIVGKIFGALYKTKSITIGIESSIHKN